MFATLLGALPAPPPVGAQAPTPAVALAQVVAAQEAAGLEPITDGLGAADAAVAVVDRWRACASLTDRAVKQVLRGPWSAAVAAEPGASRTARARLVGDLGARVHEQVLELAAAGCPLVEIEETEAHRIGADQAARHLFRAAHIGIARDVQGTHLSLSIVGGSAWEAGAATILDPPYHSLAADLIAGPDNWRLVAATPGERGIVAGALVTTAGRDEGPELLVWAAHYAASTRGRGLARVGLGTGGSLVHLSWAEAVAKLEALGSAARIAMLPAGELADAIDPRAVSSRAAALGRSRHAERKREAGQAD